MMGLFIMAALMAFQSIPIGQAVSEELTDSFSDIGKMSETKSYADIYFFNYVPNGATHSTNEITYRHGQKGGNVTWTHSQFGYDDDVNAKVDEVIKNNLQPGVESYFNEKYGGVSRRGGCAIPDINYTTRVLPAPEGDLKKSQVDYYENNIPILIRSEVPTTGAPAPIEAECSDKNGNTRYVGDSRDSTQSSSNNQNSNDGSTDNSNEDENEDDGGFFDVDLPDFNVVDSFPWNGNQNSDFSLNRLRPFVFDDFTSAGYTNQVNATGNRYHRMTGLTAVFFDNLFNEWTGVSSRYGESGWTCNLGYSHYQTAVSNAEGKVSSDINDGKDEAESYLEQQLPDGIEIKKSIITTSDELSYDVVASNFNGKTNTGRKYGSCSCDCGHRCCYDKKKATATVTPVSSRVNFTLIDNKYKILTSNTWKDLEFNVDTYYHNYEQDQN